MSQHATATPDPPKPPRLLSAEQMAKLPESKQMTVAYNAICAIFEHVGALYQQREITPDAADKRVLHEEILFWIISVGSVVRRA